MEMKFFASIIAILLLTVCSPKVEERGYVKNTAENSNWKNSVIVGKTSKQEVLEKFGSPSAQSSFGAETWYYISSRKEGVGFMKPEVVEQEVTDIQFDASGLVAAVNFQNKDDAKKINMVKRITPTEGHSLTFIDQTLGNLGRFNRPTGDSTSNNHGQH
jgi:outer membrane protein assembly factor BamE (lipoprotein component of BamABCDE complex)